MKFLDEPPPKGRPRISARYQPEIAELRANPGRWALLAEAGGAASAASMASSIRTGKYIGFRPGGSFEATSRGNAVYVRYIGDAA